MNVQTTTIFQRLKKLLLSEKALDVLTAVVLGLILARLALEYFS